jgi:hypothetical protein
MPCFREHVSGRWPSPAEFANPPEAFS